MTIMTIRDLRTIEEYYYLMGYKEWFPFPLELKKKLMIVYREEASPHTWTEQNIHEGSRKSSLNTSSKIIEYFEQNYN